MHWNYVILELTHQHVNNSLLVVVLQEYLKMLPANCWPSRFIIKNTFFYHQYPALHCLQHQEGKIVCLIRSSESGSSQEELDFTDTGQP